MPISYIAITAHSPLLIENIGKGHQKDLTNTIAGLHQIKEDLEKIDIDSILIIQDHGEKLDSAFILDMGIVEDNIAKYKSHFQEFGDFESKFEWPVDLELSLKIKSHFETGLPLQLLNNENLVYSASVPLSYIYKENTKVLNITCSLLDKEKHIEFGEELKKILIKQDKNIAIIISGDISHQDKNDPNIKIPHPFDQLILENLNYKRYEKIVYIDNDLLHSTHNCIYRPLLIMFGLLKEYNWQFKQYSYEVPFGVAYLTGRIDL